MIKRRLKCRICGTRRTVYNPSNDTRYVCPLCKPKVQAEEARKKAEARREMTTRVWWD